MRRLMILLAVAVIAADPATAGAADKTYDVVVYGGTSAGIIAAVQAARMGGSVVVVCPDRHLGGLTSGGLGWTDTGRKEAIGGLARQFYRRIKRHYDRPEAWRYEKPEQYSRYRQRDDAMWVFEPHVAEQVFEDLVAEHRIPVCRDQWLDRRDGVHMQGRRIVAITTLDGSSWRGRVFIDATYEGDLMAAAGVSYTVGRESNSQYGETLNGVQTRMAIKHQFEHPVDPYRVPGDPTSGLLPRIHPGPPGREGEGDHRVQAYCFRMCLTDVPENRRPFPKPKGYDPLQYELLARYLQTGWDAVFRKFDRIPNRKTDTNNHGAFSTDNIGMNYDYPDGSYERRRQIIAEHEQYQKGLMYFLAHDPRVPEPIRTKMSRWGLAKDEFTDNGNWPHQLYIREARRMVSDFVMTELHLRGIKPTPQPVGMGSYNMDSHNVQRYVDASGHARNEGDIQVNPGGPYPISYRAIVPKAHQCSNLLVPVCLSSSHIAYGSIRMEPVFMVLGQSAATAAMLAVRQKVAVQDVPYDKLRARLLADGQVLELPRTPRRVFHPGQLPGIVLDDIDAKWTGTWSVSSSIAPFVGAGYRHDSAANKGSCAARFEVKLKPGLYEVRLAWSAHANRAKRVPVTIHHADGVTRVLVDQTKKPSDRGLFEPLGRFRFDDLARVDIETTGTQGHVIVDAVQLLPVQEERQTGEPTPAKRSSR